jgi:hypothetical protein
VSARTPIPTGIILTDAERLECRELVARAQKTPVISFDGVTSWSQTAWQEAHRAIHRYALAHGLPEIPGYYGANLETGEVLKV